MPHEAGSRRAAELEIALFEPDIALNVGAIIRLGACLGVPVHVIEPCGFAFSERAWARSAMDYAEMAEIRHQPGWQAFRRETEGQRLVALTTAGDRELGDFAFQPGDLLLMGRESAGLPDAVHAEADARVRIAMRPGARSLNVAIAAGIAAHEALRQIATAPLTGARLRRGGVADIPRLIEIERASIALYATLDEHAFAAEGDVLDAEELGHGLREGVIFVVEDGDGPKAFAMLWIVDGRPHLKQLSVVPEAQRRGMGRALIQASLDWARAGRFDEITLTTFRDVPWNAPFYRRLGWREFVVGRDRPELSAIIAEEDEAGYPASLSCAMVKPLR